MTVKCKKNNMKEKLWSEKFIKVKRNSIWIEIVFWKSVLKKLKQVMWKNNNWLWSWWQLTLLMNSKYYRAAQMYVDYGGETHTGMGIKSMKSSGRPRGTISKRFFIFNLNARFINNWILEVILLHLLHIIEEGFIVPSTH